MRLMEYFEKLIRLVVILIFFWISPSFGSDSLRVGIVIQNSKLFDSTEFETRLARAISQPAAFRFVHLDSLDAGPFQFGRISTAVRQRLRDQKLDAVIWFNDREDSSIQIEAACADSFRMLQIAVLPFDAPIEDDFVKHIIRSLKKMSAIEKQFPTLFRIAVVTASDPSQRSWFDSLEKMVIDSLKAISINPFFAKIELIFHRMDEKNFNLDRLEEIGDNSAANLVLSCVPEANGISHSSFRPTLIVPKRASIHGILSDDSPILSGKICRLRRFDLPSFDSHHISELTDFLRGYFMLIVKQYPDAMNYFGSLKSFSASFHLAESHWDQGLVFERESSRARVDRQNAIRFWRDALSLSKNGYESALALNNIGAAFQINQQQDSAMAYYQRAYSSLNNYRDHDAYIRIAQNLGNAHLMAGQWKLALSIFESTVETMEQAKDSINLAATYENVGQIYQLLYQRNKAIAYYQKALALHEQLNNETGMIGSLNLLGNAHQENKEFPLAIRFFKQSLALSIKNHHEPKTADGYDHLGLAFQQAGELDSALFYFEKSNSLYRILDDKRGIIQTLLHQASVLQKQKLADRAIGCYEQALELLSDDDAVAAKAQIYDRLGDVYNQQNNLLPALDYYHQAASLYEQTNNFEFLSLVLFNMGLIKLKQNDYSEGYQLLKKAVSIDEQHGYNNLEGEKIFLDQIESMLKQN